MHGKFDVAVIGAGIAGSSTAYYLAKKGAKVALFDKRTFASGNTGKSSALVRHFYSTELAMKMTKLARETWANFERDVGEPLTFLRNSMVVLAKDEMKDAFNKVAKYMEKNSLKSRFLPSDELRKLLPGTVTDDVSLAFHDIEAGYVSDPVLAVAIFTRVTQRLGGVFHPWTRVTGIRLHNNSVKGVVTDNGVIRADYVVNAAGSGARAVGKMAGIDLPISSERQQIVVLRPREKVERTYPTVIDYINGFYARPEINGSMIIGRGDRGTSVRNEAFNEGSEPEEVEVLCQRASRRFPFLRGASIVRAYAGLYDVTPDEYPIIGEVEKFNGFVNACGFSHGFKLGPAVGLAVSELILDGRYGSLDLTPLNYERFKRRKLIRTFLGHRGGGTG